MADDDGIRLRNISPYGPIDVPDLGLIIEARHEVVVPDEDLAQRLIDTGHFTAVGKPGPKAHDDTTPPAPADEPTSQPAPAPAEIEEPTGDHAA